MWLMDQSGVLAPRMTMSSAGHGVEYMKSGCPCFLPEWVSIIWGISLLIQIYFYISSKKFNMRRVNTLRPSDDIWRYRSGSTLVQVMARCLVVTNHYLNKCWLITTKVPWHSYEGIVISRSDDTNQENCIFKIEPRSPKHQWVLKTFILPRFLEWGCLQPSQAWRSTLMTWVMMPIIQALPRSQVLTGIILWLNVDRVCL